MAIREIAARPPSPPVLKSRSLDDLREDTQRILNDQHVSIGLIADWIEHRIKATAASYEVVDETVIIATAGGITVTLPASNSDNINRDVHVKNIAGTAITVERRGTDTIDGATSYTITNQYESRHFIADGVGGWHILALNNPAAGGGGFTGFANPVTPAVKLTTTNGVATTALRSDVILALDQDIAPTWTSPHIWTTGNAAEVPVTINAHASQTADLLNIVDKGGGIGVRVDGDSLVGINIDPTAMLAIQGGSISATEVRTVIYWTNAGVERGFFRGGGTLGAWTWTGEYTLDAWIKIDTTVSVAGGNNMIAFIGGGTFIHGMLYMDTTFHLNYHNFNNVEGAVVQIISPLTYNDGLWHHVAAVHRKNPGDTDHRMSLYVDGILVVEGTGSAAHQGFSGAGNLAWYIGCLDIGAGIVGSCQGIAMAGIKYRQGVQYNTTVEGAIVGNQIFTPPLPAAVTGDIKDVDLDDGSGTNPVEDVVSDSLGIVGAGSGTPPVWQTSQSVTIGGGSLDLTRWYDSIGAVRSKIDEAGRFGYGITDPAYPVDLIQTATQQRIGYDSTTNYYTTDVGSAGVVTFDANGASHSFLFLDPVTIRSTTAPQFTIGYDTSNRFETSVASNGAVTFNAVGAGQSFTFSDPVTVSGLFTASTASFVSTTTPQLTVGYDSSNLFTVSVASNGTTVIDGNSASSTFTINDSLGIGVAPTTNKFQVLSTTTPQARISYDGTHFLTIGVASTGATTLAPATDDGVGLIQFLIKPSTALSTTADGRATFAVQRSSGANPTAFICHANGVVEFSGASGSALDSVMVVRSSIGKAYGMRFEPTGNSSSGASIINYTNALTGLYVSQSPSPSSAPPGSAYFGGVFDGPTYVSLTTDAAADTWGGIFRPVASSTGNGARTFARVGGFRIKPISGGTNFGAFTNLYGGYIENMSASAATTGFSIATCYGLYIEEQNRATVNNGIFIAGGGLQYVMRDQDHFISSRNPSEIQINSSAKVILSLGNSGSYTNLIELTNPAAYLATFIDALDVAVGSGSGTKWATATTQKQAWWNATPVVQPDGSSPVHTTLDTLGLRVNADGDTYGIVCVDNEVVCVDDVVVVI